MRKNLDKYMSNPDTKVIILTLTNSCNLSCVYCYEHNKEEKCLNLKKALEIIEYEMTVDDGSNFVCVYYFGGEPYIQFDKIKAIHSFLKSKRWSKGWFAFTTTNGTLVHDDIQQWLKDNDDSIEVYISLDGTKEMHDRNRSNSFDKIDIEFFKKNYPFAKMTVTEKTLPYLAEGAISLHEKGFEVSANLGHGVKWNKDSHLILAEQLNLLISYYLEHLDIKPANILNMPILDLDPGTDKPRRFCGVGPMMKSYDVDGEVYPCHAFAPLCIGKKKALESKKLDFSCPLSLLDLDEKCRSCPVVGYCPTCYGINYGISNNVYHMPNDHCLMMKVQFLANAKFKYIQYSKNLLDLKPEEELKLLRNIKAVQELAL